MLGSETIAIGAADPAFGAVWVEDGSLVPWWSKRFQLVRDWPLILSG